MIVSAGEGRCAQKQPGSVSETSEESRDFFRVCRGIFCRDNMGVLTRQKTQFSCLGYLLGSNFKKVLTFCGFHGNFDYQKMGNKMLGIFFRPNSDLYLGRKMGIRMTGFKCPVQDIR